MKPFNKRIICALFALASFGCSEKPPSPTDESGAAVDAHAKLMQEMSKPLVEIKTVAILLYDGYTSLDATGPFQVLSGLMNTKVFYVGTRRGLIADQRGTKIQVDLSINDIDQADILLIPGGTSATVELSRNERVLNWIRKIDEKSVYTTSVCTGAWILGATGLLKDRKATTHWYRAEEMLARYGAHFQKERWVRDGKYWTSAGVTAAMDMSLALIQEIRGEKYLQAVMLDLEYDPAPPIRAGSVDNTDPVILQMMREMYDSGMLPLLESETDV